MFAQDLKALQDFLAKTIAKLEGVTVVSSNIIAKIVKEQPGIILRPGLGLRLTCNFCGREIKGKPETHKIGDREHSFCCKTCRASYKEKYQHRLRSLSKT
ncbi:TRASH domain-containing protein [Candidatus Hecatella orcuttiae]|uniref:TRASH domain-containing protein n=1 Tax=Candidatus Hecatella orcuttiae TaxID=1935119 RepID=UPI0039C866FD